MNAGAKHWLWPSIALVLFAILAWELHTPNLAFLTDPASGRHLKAGEIILQNHAVLHADPFSYHQPPLEWISFEWLFEAAAAWLAKLGGLTLPYSVGFCLWALIPVALWRYLINRNIIWPVAIVYTLLCMLFFRSHLLLRPFLITYLFMIVTVASWQTHERLPRLRDWLLLPLVYLLWANIHGGFAAGLVFLGASWAGKALDSWRNRGTGLNQSHLWWLLLIFVCAVATVMNPHGLGLHSQVWDMVFHIKTYAYWHEFQPPDFATPNALAVAVLVLLASVLAGRALPGAAQWKLETILPLVIFFYFGLKAQRHVLLLLIVAAYPVCRDWQSLFSQKRMESFINLSHAEKMCRSHWWQIPLCALALIWTFYSTTQAARLRIGALNVSGETITCVNRNTGLFRKPLTTTWNAGALIYYLWPKIKVSFDDRTDLYGDARLCPYINMLYLKPGWEAALRAGGYDSAILEPTYPLAQALQHLPDWEMVQNDSLNCVFVRKTALREGKP
jgi:hypothetical protein